MNLPKLTNAFSQHPETATPVADVPSVASDEAAPPSYDQRVASEQRFFAQPSSVTELPAIYQYWSNRFLRPRLASAGFDGPLDMFRRALSDSYEKSERGERRFLSIGSGDCKTEISLAENLIRNGQRDFVFECLELNPTLVASAIELARARDVSAQISIVEADLNTWSPSCEYDAVLANSSLHHIQNLEHVFDGVARSLSSWGTFVTSDTIGRNGHMRWPEALEIVEEFWRELPKEHRFNHQLQRHEDAFEDWDCSSEGFEGIRAQDILPLLIERFDFDFFAGFANVIDPFIDRSFGHNFDSSRSWDRAFIDRVEARDVAEIRNGRIKPTHLVAAMCVDRPGRNVCVDGLTPRFCVRHPSRRPRPMAETVRAVQEIPVMSARELAEDASTLIDLDVLPAQPKKGDYLIARVSIHDGEPRARGTLPCDAMKVTITAQATMRIPLVAGTIELPLGSYPAGDVHIATKLGNRRLSTKLRIPDGDEKIDRAVAPALNYSDLWWNASESGWGLSIHQHANGQLVALWLGFDEDGTPTWLSLNPGKWVTARAFEGPVFRHTGSSALETYDASELRTELAGAGSLVFDSFNTGRLILDLRDTRIVKDIERMRF